VQFLTVAVHLVLYLGINTAFYACDRFGYLQQYKLDRTPVRGTRGQRDTRVPLLRSAPPRSASPTARCLRLGRAWLRAGALWSERGKPAPSHVALVAPATQIAPRVVGTTPRPLFSAAHACHESAADGVRAVPVQAQLPSASLIARTVREGVVGQLVVGPLAAALLWNGMKSFGVSNRAPM
jgi:hypothetical protein